MKQIKTMLVISRVAHYEHAGRFYAYTPYAREIDIWADLFPHIAIAGTLHRGPPPSDCTPFKRDNITVWPVADPGSRRLAQFLSLPLQLWQLSRYMLRADAIQVRCPADLGLLGVLLAPLFSRQLYAKYATQWTGFPDESWVWRLQRLLLRSRWWHGPVTVYGDWPHQPRNVVPFFTSVLTEAQVAQARTVVATKLPVCPPLRLLYVGRLAKAKNVDMILEALAATGLNGQLHCTIVGDGPERAALEALATRLGLQAKVQFTGAISFERVLEHYAQADVLMLTSDMEGWPKAIAEGMTFGLVCIGTDRGLVPQMLGEGRGLLVPHRDCGALTAALRQVAIHPEQYAPMAQRAAAWAQRHSLEGLREALRELLATWWKPLP